MRNFPIKKLSLTCLFVQDEPTMESHYMCGFLHIWHEQRKHLSRAGMMQRVPSTATMTLILKVIKLTCPS